MLLAEIKALSISNLDLRSFKLLLIMIYVGKLLIESYVLVELLFPNPNSLAMNSVNSNGYIYVKCY